MIESEAYHYTKNKNGKRTGNTVCVLVKEGRIFFGEAICSPEDQFSRAKGREVAKKKAYFSYARWIAKATEKELNKPGLFDSFVNKVTDCFFASSKL